MFYRESVENRNTSENYLQEIRAEPGGKVQEEFSLSVRW